METTNNCLVNKLCTPCHGDVPPLATEEISKLLKELGHERYGLCQ